MADLSKMVGVGDSIECDVTYPWPGKLRVSLDTAEAAAEANELLLDPNSGWRKVIPGVDSDVATLAGLAETNRRLVEVEERRKAAADKFGLNDTDGVDSLEGKSHG